MIQKPRGTKDLYGINADIYEHILKTCISVVKRYSYKFIQTPLFEDKSLFLRSIGEDTDIVNKELFYLTSLSKDDNNYALRPEATASVTRSILENKLYQNKLIRLFYFGPMFRYERPQKGRFREFNQFGIEALGSSSLYLDVECIKIALNILDELKIEDFVLKINSLGTILERKQYLIDLVKYLTKYESELCEDCQKRIKKNPLRILDCKIDKDKAFMKDVPKLLDYLGKDSKDNFNQILKSLENNKIKYEISNKLVRGLDYYEGTIFEIEANSTLGSQATLIGGGRYNKLSENLGSKIAIPSFGFALGIERLSIILKEKYQDKFNLDNLDCFFILLSEASEDYFNKISDLFFQNNINFSRVFNYNFKDQCKQANNNNAKYLIIIGDKDIENNTFTLQNNISSERKIFNINNILECIKYIKKA